MINTKVRHLVSMSALASLKVKLCGQVGELQDKLRARLTRDSLSTGMPVPVEEGSAPFDDGTVRLTVENIHRLTSGVSTRVHRHVKSC